MNVELLEKVKQHILEEPKRFAMELFEINKEDYPTAYQYPKCGTVACIAGWACILSGVRPLNWEQSATNVLGINPDQAGRLFFEDNWPETYADEYLSHKEQSKGRAEAACKRIDHFIATNGAE